MSTSRAVMVKKAPQQQAARSARRPALPNRRAATCPAGPAARSRRTAVLVRAHDEGEMEMLPLFRLPTQDAPESLPKPKLLGGKTLGEELILIKRAMDTAEKEAASRMRAELYSNNWDGDVYIGSPWNVGSVLAIISLVTPLLGLLFAYLSYGTLWTGNYVPTSLYF